MKPPITVIPKEETLKAKIERFMDEIQHQLPGCEINLKLEKFEASDAPDLIEGIEPSMTVSAGIIKECYLGFPVIDANKRRSCMITTSFTPVSHLKLVG